MRYSTGLTTLIVVLLSKLLQNKWAMIMALLNNTVTINRLKVVFDFNWASTALLYAMQNMVTKNSPIILIKVRPPDNSIIAATAPIQLCGIMAMEAYPVCSLLNSSNIL